MNNSTCIPFSTCNNYVNPYRPRTLWGVGSTLDLWCFRKFLPMKNSTCILFCDASGNFVNPYQPRTLHVPWRVFNDEEIIYRATLSIFDAFKNHFNFCRVCNDKNTYVWVFVLMKSFLIVSVTNDVHSYGWKYLNVSLMCLFILMNNWCIVCVNFSSMLEWKYSLALTEYFPGIWMFPSHHKEMICLKIIYVRLISCLHFFHIFINVLQRIITIKKNIMFPKVLCTAVLLCLLTYDVHE